MAADALGEASQAGDISKALSEKAAGETFGERLAPRKEEASGLPKSWIAIAACVGVLVIGGGVTLFHRSAPSSSGSAASAPATASPSVSPSVAGQPVQAAQPVAASPVAKPVAAPANSTREAPVTATPKPVREPSSDVSEQPEAASSNASRKTVPSVFGTPNAHPVSARKSAAGAVAPSLEVSLTDRTKNPLLGITSTPAALGAASARL